MKAIIILLIFSINLPLLGQVGIGNTPDASAQLDIAATNKGVLIPRVSFANVTNSTLDGINQAPEGLTIYNTNDNIVGGNGKGFYFFNGTKWSKLIPQQDNVAIISIDTNQVTVSNTSGADVAGYDAAIEPIFFNKNGQLQIKLIVRYSAINGIVNFQLRAHDNLTETYPIKNTDFSIFAATQTGGVATSDWKNWDAGTNAQEIHLFAWVNNGGDYVSIESAYLYIRSQ